MRILITGITGFAGGHLADFLSHKKGLEIYGLARRTRPGQKKIYSCDICDTKKLAAVIRQVRPERIFHLAGQASIQKSWEDPKDTFEQNLIGTLNLFEAVRSAKLSPWIQVTGSAHEYGIPKGKVNRIDEATPMNPLSPYAVSKISQDLLANLYAWRFGMKIVRTRAFNHIGPRQSPDFVTASFARQVALIEAGRQEPEILAGNLDSIRDYTDARDVARAYWLSLEKGKAGEVYNIASGKGHNARQILAIYLKLSRVKFKVKLDQARLRPTDSPRLVGDAQKLKRQTGWSLRIPFERSLADILEFWREKIKHEKN